MANEEEEGLISGSPSTLKDNAPVLIRYRASKAFTLITVCLALFTDSFIYGVLVPVFPFSLEDRCDVDPDRVQLWTSALFAAFGIAILLGSPGCGWLADHTTSRRAPLLSALPILVLATIMIGVGRNPWIFFFSMLLHGFGTAVTWTVGLALTRDTAGKDQVGQWMGTALSSSSFGLIISPLLGGIVYNQAGIWGPLGMIFALIVLNIFTITSMIERHVAQSYMIDPRSDVEGTRGYGTLQDPHDAKNHSTDCPNSNLTPDMKTSSVACDCDALDTSSSKSTPEPTKPLTPPMLLLLRMPRVLTGVFGVFTQFGILASFDAFLPLFVSHLFHWSSLGAGLIFLNIAIPALLGPLAGRISDRYGPRRVALVGCVLTAPPLFCIRFVDRDEKAQIVLLCVLLVLAGLSLTLIISPLAADLSFAVDQKELDSPGCFGDAGAYAQAYALFNCSMAAATVVGPLLAGGLNHSFGAGGVSLALAAWCVLAAVPVFFFVGDGVQAPPARDIEQPVPRRLSFSRPA